MTKEKTQDALVTGAYSRRMVLQLADESIVDARIKGKKLKPVCGDRVSASEIPNESEWLITAIHPRENELTRPDSRGRKDILAANLDCVVVMAAVEPKVDWFIVDRYLAAAENMRASAVVTFNKADLLDSEAALPDVLAEYAAIGYPAIDCSAESGQKLEQLAQQLAGQTAIIVGQSGVGKSSVINRLAAGSAQKIGALSDSSREGRHTTVNSVMLGLPDGGRVIDSPGVRDYAPAIEHEEEVSGGYREISERGKECRFANCRHLREPGCAVKNAVESGELSPRRYESYKRLMTLTRALPDRRH